MIFTEAEKEVLDLAVEDYYSLFEIRNSSTRLAPALKSLLDRGMIALFVREGETVEPLDASAYTAILDIENWDPDRASRHLVFTATDKGEEFYQSLE